MKIPSTCIYETKRKLTIDLFPSGLMLDGKSQKYVYDKLTELLRKHKLKGWSIEGGYSTVFIWFPTAFHKNVPQNHSKVLWWRNFIVVMVRELTVGFRGE